jgi:hypothetical protein
LVRSRWSHYTRGANIDGNHGNFRFGHLFRRRNLRILIHRKLEEVHQLRPPVIRPLEVAPVFRVGLRKAGEEAGIEGDGQKVENGADPQGNPERTTIPGPRMETVRDGGIRRFG